MNELCGVKMVLMLYALFMYIVAPDHPVHPYNLILELHGLRDNGVSFRPYFTEYQTV